MHKDVMHKDVRRTMSDQNTVTAKYKTQHIY